MNRTTVTIDLQEEVVPWANVDRNDFINKWSILSKTACWLFNDATKKSQDH